MMPTLRPSTPADEKGVTQYSRRAYQIYVERLGYPPLPMTEDYSVRINRGGVWVLDDGGSIVGVLALDTEPDGLLIYSVAVDPSHQGRRLGRRLLETAESEARARGIKRLIPTCIDQNPFAHSRGPMDMNCQG
ncbi:MAG: GNAT family N-acetyltransferase [Alphaproteobacteria bacterium]|nr:GNAT family N-acetyltransferase [Alphaproteobacteria bacterium]